MKIIKTEIDGLVVIEPKIFGDERGYFFESFQESRYQDAGIDYRFIQDNRSRSEKGVLRGLHFQKTKPQGKLVSVLSGDVLDVAVDLRPDSSTFSRYEAVILSGDNKRQFFVPPGFAHGFLVLSEFADFHYKCTEYYDPADESGIIWNDPDLDITWNIESPCLSEKDKLLPQFAEIQGKLRIEDKL
jgi:dTDP-4-dehydrorhamnose 3,5-epimerase